MRNKVNVLNKLDLISGTISKIDIAMSRGNRDAALGFLEEMKEKIEELRDFISVEPDDFEQQFKG